MAVGVRFDGTDNKRSPAGRRCWHPCGWDRLHATDGSD